MKGVFAIVVAIGCSAPTPAPTTQSWAVAPADARIVGVDAATATVSTAPGECLDDQDVAIVAAEREVAEATRVSFEAELVKQELTAIVLPAKQKDLGRGLQTDNVTNRGTTVKTTIGGDKGTFVTGDAHWSGAGTPPPAWEFVQDKKGNVYSLVRQPQVAATEIMICGCAVLGCPSIGSGCPACGTTTQAMYGPLPKGTRYKGELIVAYPARALVYRYAEVASCKPQPACAAPP